MSHQPQYELVDDPAGFHRAAARLAAGRGPFAVDTERASSFRYGDRAFLVQVYRPGAGAYLIAPEGYRAEFRSAFAPVLNHGTWILHAAGEDLPSLAELGLHAGALFDTELAGRIVGYTRTNLGAMVEQLVGVHLEKGHGREDWSTVPLPKEWQDYAALDVLYLHDLADALTCILAENDKLDIAEQEFTHILRTRSQAPEQGTWRDVKGISRITSRESLQIARALWEHREDIARSQDRSPNRLLPNKVLVDIATNRPRNAAEIRAIPGFPRRRHGAAERCAAILHDARGADPSTWPRPQRHGPSATPSNSTLKKHYPQAWECISAARSEIESLATELDLNTSTLVNARRLRSVLWGAMHAENAWSIDQAYAALETAGARPWQCELVAPIIVAANAHEVPTPPART